jgi:hypothetical protein
VIPSAAIQLFWHSLTMLLGRGCRVCVCVCVCVCIVCDSSGARYSLGMSRVSIIAMSKNVPRVLHVIKKVRFKSSR